MRSKSGENNHERRRSGRQPTDLERRQFIDRLDRAPFEVTDLEALLIEECLEELGRFTAVQRQSIDQLMEKYLTRL